MILKKQQTLIFIIITLFFIISINCVSGSDFHVNKDTTHKNITDWIKKDAKKGDKLIFTSNYNLTNTLVISKSINIKSYKNTKIYFNKSKNMFNINTSSVNFTKLTIIHKPTEKINYSFNNEYYYSISTLFAPKPVKINIKNVNIYVNNQMKVLYIPQKDSEYSFYEEPYYEQLDYTGINIYKGYGNITNCNIKINNGRGLGALKWEGNIKNSTFLTKNGRGINTQGWTGNIIDSKFRSEGGEEQHCISIFGTLNGNIERTSISLNGISSRTLFIQWQWKGNLINSSIKAKGEYCNGIVSRLWNGTLYNSKITSNGQYSSALYNCGGWNIKIIKSKILTYGNETTTIYTDGGTCEILNSKIYSYGLAFKYKGAVNSRIRLFESKGMISNSIIKQTNGYAIAAPEAFKITNCKIITTNGPNKIFRLKPDLKVTNVSKSKNTYSITVNNIGLLTSKTCYLSFKTKNTYKIAKIKKIGVDWDVGGNIPDIIKIKIPKKYASKKYTKTIKLDIYNQNQEQNKKNNIYKFKF